MIKARLKRQPLDMDCAEINNPRLRFEYINSPYSRTKSFPPNSTFYTPASVQTLKDIVYVKR